MRKDNIFEITHYEAVFNDENLTCGFTINLDEYNIPTSEKEKWKFSIDFKNNQVLVNSDNYSLIFMNADMDLLIRVAKTDKLPILYGRSNNNSIGGMIISTPLI